MAGRTYFSLMRHAETDWNRQKRIQGQTQTSITEQGRLCSLDWGRALHAWQGLWTEPGPVRRIVCSDLFRAVQTAKLLNRSLDLPLSTDARLQEQDWGRWTTRRIRDLRTENAAEVARQEALGWNFCPPGGEARIAVLERSWNALLDLARAHPGEHILVVTHQGILKCLMYRLLQMRFLPEEGNPLQPNAVHTIYLDQADAPAMEAGPGRTSGDPQGDHPGGHPGDHPRDHPGACHGGYLGGCQGGYVGIWALNQDILGE